MKFEWDDRKADTNYKKHGIRFEEAALIFEGLLLTKEDTREDYGEKRYISIGLLRGLVILVVAYTKRDKVMRLISARRANRRERKRYDEYIKEKLG